MRTPPRSTRRASSTWPASGTTTSIPATRATAQPTQARDDGVEVVPVAGCALDVVVRRNAFGRQVDSFEADLDVDWLKSLVSKPRLRPYALRLLADRRHVEPPRVGLGVGAGEGQGPVAVALGASAGLGAATVLGFAPFYQWPVPFVTSMLPRSPRCESSWGMPCRCPPAPRCSTPS